VDAYVADVRMQYGPERGWLAVELWTEAPSSDAEALKHADDVLEEVFAELCVLIAATDEEARVQSHRYGGTLASPLDRTDAAAQAEWFDARMFAGAVSPAQIQFFLGATRRSGEPLVTATYSGQRLKVGPEPAVIPTVIDAARRLESSMSRAARLRRQAQATAPRWSWWYTLPLSPLFLMVVAWSLPLTWAWMILLGTLLVGLFATTVWAYRRYVFSKLVLGAALAVFVLGGFGDAYAIDQLVERNPLGPVAHLGYPYLVATGLAVVAGIVTPGSLHGAAKVVAHIQLLLFATFVGGAAAVLATVALHIEERLETVGAGLADQRG
jgi:hypothetical protein